MNKKQLCAAAAAAVMISCTLTACTKKDNDKHKNDSSKASIETTLMPISVPDTSDVSAATSSMTAEKLEPWQNGLADIELTDKTVRFLSNCDLNPGAEEPRSPSLEGFYQYYDGTVEFIETTWTSRYDDLAKKIISGDSPDFFDVGEMDAFPKGAVQQMFQPIDDYIDLDSEIWEYTKTASDSFVFGGSHYAAVIDIVPNYVCIYNRTTIEDMGYEDPAALYYDGEWDWNIFEDMCVDFTDPDNGKYGLDGYWFNNAISETSGLPLIGYKDGKLVNNMSEDAVCKAQDFMYALQENNVMFDRSENNWATRGNGTTGYGVGTGETLFIPAGLWALEETDTSAFGDIESGEVMFAPMPVNPDNDDYYTSARIKGYALCNGAPNPEGFACLMNCMAALRTYDEEYLDQKLREEYKWTDEMIDMRNEIYGMAYENPVFAFNSGVSADMDILILNVSQATMQCGGQAVTWKECRDEYEEDINSLIEEVNSAL